MRCKEKEKKRITKKRTKHLRTSKTVKHFQKI